MEEREREEEKGTEYDEEERVEGCVLHYNTKFKITQNEKIKNRKRKTDKKKEWVGVILYTFKERDGGARNPNPS